MIRAVNQVLLGILEKLTAGSSLDEGQILLNSKHLQDGLELVLGSLWSSFVSWRKWVAIAASEQTLDLLVLVSFLLHCECHQLV